MKHATLIKVVAVLITLILLAILLSQIDIVDVVTTLTSISPISLIAAFSLYACCYLFRTLRFYILLNKEVGLHNIFKIVCVHNMVNNILPARTGELSYVYLLKKIQKRTIGDGVATLVIARILDFIVISAIFLLSLQFLRDTTSTLVNSTWVGVIIIMAMVILLILLLYSGRLLFRGIKSFFEKLHLIKWHFGTYILVKTEETVESLIKIKSIGLLKYFQLLLVSCGIWLSLYLFVYILVIGMGISAGFLAVLFASTFAIISTVLPIQGLGGFGTIEAAWTIGFMIIGLTKVEAICSGFGYHIVSLIFFSIFGIYGFLTLKIWNIKGGFNVIC